jgi:hypothetical protein
MQAFFRGWLRRTLQGMPGGEKALDLLCVDVQANVRITLDA